MNVIIKPTLESLSWALQAQTGTGTRKLILLYLAIHGKAVQVAHEQIAEATELSVRTIINALWHLAQDGFLTVHPQLDTNGGTRPNLYELHPPAPSNPLDEEFNAWWDQDGFLTVHPQRDKDSGMRPNLRGGTRNTL